MSALIGCTAAPEPKNRNVSYSLLRTAHTTFSTPATEVASSLRLVQPTPPLLRLLHLCVSPALGACGVRAKSGNRSLFLLLPTHAVRHLLHTAVRHNTYSDTARHWVAQHGTACDTVAAAYCSTALLSSNQRIAQETGINSTDILRDKNKSCKSFNKFMDEKVVIAAVAAHRSLYDQSHMKYKDVELRNAIWQKIASDLEMEVEGCKAKWRTLRDGFTRSLRHQKDTKNVHPSKARKPWRYQTEMEFLIPFIYSRESRSSPQQRDQDFEEDSDQGIQNQTSSSGTDGSDDTTLDDESTLSITSDSAAVASDPPPFRTAPFVSLSQSYSSFKRKCDSDDIADKLKYQRLELDAVLNGWEQSSPSPKAAHCQCKSRVEDPTEAFFFSMGQSVKRLPFYLQAQVKMKVCQLVTDAEMECLDSASVR
ncbi:hypothetical protein V1264_012331 [Littorina saxatilis]|uniref:MADF domain-containing protein n=2 Tax=Littorina saxatilis TaxID=31220 RepID=A0AAN9C1M1_9CAEN